MEHTIANPFIPKASLIKCPNGIFEIHLHLHGVVCDVEVSPFDNYLLVSGKLAPHALTDCNQCQGKASALVWTDQDCGHFGREIPINLHKGTEAVVLDCKHVCDDYIVRFTVRNSDICNNGAPRVGNTTTRCNPCGTCVGLSQSLYGNHNNGNGCRCGGSRSVQTHWGHRYNSSGGCGCGHATRSRCGQGSSGCGCGGSAHAH